MSEPTVHMPDESFANEPLTAGERRAEKVGTAQAWAPRDLLIKLLRDHDSGKLRLEDIVVCWAAGDEFGWWNASDSTLKAMGLLACAMGDLGHQAKTG